MRLMTPFIALFAINILSACNGLPPTIPAPGPYVTEELIGEWRVVSLHHDGSQATEATYDDDLNVVIEYTENSLRIDNGCAPAERPLYANYGLYEVLAVSTDHIDNCEHGSDENLHLFDLANPLDGYYNVFEDELQLFDIEADLRVTLMRITQS